MSSALLSDLVSRGTSYRHTQASALESLLAAGVPESKISFRFDGSGGKQGLVAAQHPPAGTSHENVDKVVVTISGFGLFHHLPFGMRLDTEDADQVSTSELLDVFRSGNGSGFSTGAMKLRSSSGSDRIAMTPMNAGFACSASTPTCGQRKSTLPCAVCCRASIR